MTSCDTISATRHLIHEQPETHMWRRKICASEKLKRRVQAEKRRRDVAPTRAELKNEHGARAYSSRHGLSHKATQRIVDLVTGAKYEMDWSDQRGMHPQDRVPRSLEVIDTPPRFWDVTDPCRNVQSLSV